MERLNAIFSIIPDCDVLGDIGCDHGKLTRRVRQENRAKRVIATDISEKCLSKARELNSDLEGVEFLLGDGLKALDGRHCDVIVISGMGGNTMIDILQPLPNSVLVLQPQSDVPKLREFLLKSGYFIDADFVITEAGKFYDVIRAQKGKMQADQIQLEFGIYYKTPNIYLKSRLEKLIEKTQKFKPTPKNLEVIHKAKEALKWQP